MNVQRLKKLLENAPDHATVIIEVPNGNLRCLKMIEVLYNADRVPEQVRTEDNDEVRLFAGWDTHN